MVRYILTYLLILFGVTSVFAQQMDVRGRLIVSGRESSNPKKVVEDPYEEKDKIIYVFWTKVSADEFIEEFRRTKKPGRYDDRTITGENGVFTYQGAQPGFCFVALYRDQPKVIVLNANNAKALNFNYDDPESRVLASIDVDGKPPLVPIPDPEPPICFGKQTMFTIKFHVPMKDYWTRKSRLIIAPVAVDCTTEDTVAYLKGGVYDAGQYHMLQDRRMDFDVESKDPVASCFLRGASVVIDSVKDMMDVQFVIPYLKPDEKRSYTCMATCVLENYNREYFKLSGEFGSCFERRPFRFLEFNLPFNTIELSEEYYEAPSSGLVDLDIDLPLKFVRGKAELSDDPQNPILEQKLYSELKKYGNSLQSIKVIGGASPDGSVEVNTRLANQRAQLALSKIKQNLPNWRRVRIQEPEAIIYTWENVVDSLVAHKDTTRANFVRSLIASGQNIWMEVRADSVIGNILNNMMVMKFQYKYQENKPLEPQEALDRYYHDPEYKPGGSKRFSNGDWYNMLVLEKDPKKLKQIVYSAHKAICTGDEKNFRTKMFPLYLANRVALYSIEDGKPDTSVLKPFLDLTLPLDNQREEAGGLVRWVVNRHELVANQAIMLLKLSMLNAAKLWINLMPQDSEIAKAVNRYMCFIEAILHSNDLAYDRTKVDQGKKYGLEIMAEDLNNRAILGTELTKELKTKKEDALEAVKLLDNKNPKKWYLMALHVAKNAGTPADQRSVLAASQPEDSTAVSASPTNNEYSDVPQFLAYLQGAFDIEPSFKEHYASEALIEKSIYEKYPYDPRKAARYRARFKQLTGL